MPEVGFGVEMNVRDMSPSGTNRIRREISLGGLTKLKKCTLQEYPKLSTVSFLQRKRRTKLLQNDKRSDHHEINQELEIVRLLLLHWLPATLSLSACPFIKFCSSSCSVRSLSLYMYGFSLSVHLFSWNEN